MSCAALGRSEETVVLIGPTLLTPLWRGRKGICGGGARGTAGAQDGPGSVREGAVRGDGEGMQSQVQLFVPVIASATAGFAQPFKSRTPPAWAAAELWQGRLPPYGWLDPYRIFALAGAFR